MQKNSESQENSNIKPENNKRYLILTYMVEFDKVHYPLPLNFDENPDIDTLKNTIRRLRLEIDSSKSGNDNNAALNKLRNENEILRMKMKRIDEVQ